MKNLVLASYNANLAEELLSLWRESFEARGLQRRPPQTFDP